MAITTTERTNILKLVVAMFNAPAGATYLEEIVSTYEAGGKSLSALAVALSNTGAYKALNPNFQSPQDFAAKFLTPYGLQGNDIARDFIIGKFNANPNPNKGLIALEAATAINNYTGTDVGILAAQSIQNNKASVAEFFSVTRAIPQTDLALLQQAFAGVTAAATSVAEANASIDGVNNGAARFVLTTGFDRMFGTAAADSFTSNVVQNDLGQQVNTLGSGDTLNGGAGVDSLKATITGGVFAGITGAGGNSPIQPTTTSIESVKIEAVNANLVGAGVNTTVLLNAKDMAGLTSIGSSRSDANLVIQNLTTKDNLGGNTRSLSDITITMEYTGNSDTRWNESDQAVYFDQDYIVTSNQTSFTKARVDIRLMNEDKYDIDFAAGLRGNQINALAGVFINKLVITVNGAVFNLGELINETPSNPPDARTDFIKTYPELLAAVQVAVAQLKANNPTNLALQSLQAVNGIQFLSDISPVAGVGRREGTAVMFEMDGSTNGVVNTIVVKAQDLVITPLINTPIPNSNRFERAEETRAVPTTQELPLKINLEKVGLAGDGGELIVGSMFKDGTNAFTDLYKGKGITKFEVTVSGNSEKPSSLSGLHSTGNNLREVTVKTNAAELGTFSSLTIGNSQTDAGGGFNVAPVNGGRGLVKFPVANGLQGLDVTLPSAANQFAMKDVQTFDASGLKGSLTLFAALTDDVVPKYMNLKDSPAAAAADNVQFAYTGGSVNDYINLHLSAGNLAAAGTTTREDFVLTVNGGAGDDEIVTMIGNGSSGTAGINGVTLTTTDNWYVNSKINANLTVNGGAGDDTVRTIGAGDFKINGEGGNDTVYADNSGGKAVYVFNVADGDIVAVGNQYNIDNLRSQDAASVSGVNANLTVTFRDITKTVVIANSEGALANVAITDLAVNQAIKEAINKDPVLSKLLVAVDGPGNSLVVRSLIDGFDARPADLSIAFGTTGALSAAQVAAVTPVTLFAPATSTAVTDGYVTTNFAQNGVGSDSVAFVAGVAPTLAVTETATMTATTAMVAGETYTIAGLTYTSTAATTPTQLAAAFASLANGATTGAGTATGTYSGTLTGYSTGAASIFNVVTFTSSTAATNVADLTDSGSRPDAAAAGAATFSPATTTQGTPTTTEVTSMTGVTGLAAGSTYTVAGLSFTAGNLGATQGQLLAAFASLANGATTGVGTAFGSYSGTLTGYTTSTSASNVVIFTPTAVGDKVPDLDDSGSTRFNDSPAATVLVTNQGQAASAGVTAVAATNGANEILGFNSISASDNVITGGTGNDVVVLGKTTGVTALTASNDTVRYEAGLFGNDTVVNFGANTIVDTTASVQEVFSATFAGDENGGDTTIAFDGVTVLLADTDNTAALIATKFVATYNAVALTTWTAVQTAGTGVVTFTSKLAGDRNDVNTFTVTPGATADLPLVTVVAAAPATQGTAPVIDADLFDFVLLGGDINATFTNFNSLVLDKSIVVAAGTSSITVVQAAFTDSLTAMTHVYVGYDVATNIANVYAVTDAAGVGGIAAVLVGTIDLADTLWATLTATNFV